MQAVFADLVCGNTGTARHVPSSSYEVVGRTARNGWTCRVVRVLIWYVVLDTCRVVRVLIWYVVLDTCRVVRVLPHTKSANTACTKRS